MLKPCYWDNTIQLEKLKFKNPIVEIGFGNGDFTLWLAQNFPSPILAVEKWHPGIRALINKCRAKKLNNIYVFQLDAHIFVKYLLFPNSVEKFFFNYPDPFFKKRDLKRRILKRDFILWLLFKLKEEGKIYIRTDIKDYYEFIIENLKQLREYLSWETDFDIEVPPTKYELKALREGRKPLKLLIHKRKTPPLKDWEVVKVHTVKLKNYDLRKIPLRKTIKSENGRYFLKVENVYYNPEIDLLEIFVGEEGFYQHVFIGIFKTEKETIIKPKSFAVGVKSVAWAVEKIAELITK
jgi:tRNA (guanine-N7-)-methyltransferase